MMARSSCAGEHRADIIGGLIVCILVIEPERRPEVREINGSLKTMQDTVGGLIQPIYLDDSVVLVCNDEGKLMNLAANRVLRDENGTIYDIVCGTFFLCGVPPNSNEFKSLTDAQVEKYRELFRHPEIFLNVNGQIVVLPCNGR